MDTLKNKRYGSFTYISRYNGIPYYYDTLKNREVFGIGSNVHKDIDAFSYKINAGDNLDSLALKYYNNPSLWWVLAYFNDTIDAFKPLEPGTVIKIPSLSSISFGAQN